MTKSDKNDAIKSRVGLAVAAAVEPMPVGLAGGGGYRIDSAQRGECSLEPPSTGKPTKGEADTPLLGGAMRHSQHAMGRLPGNMPSVPG